MIKSRTIQIIYQTSFCSIAVIALLSSVGFFDAKFENNFYVYFTNLSNYFCVIMMFLELKQSIYKKQDSYVSVSPVLKFFGVISILITFFIFNLLLAKDRSIEQNMSVNSVLLHVILPIMFTLDWIIFYERGKIRWFYPIGAMLIPVIYVCFIFIRGWSLNWEGELIFPYFFFDINKIGITGVLRWIFSLLIIFLVFGYSLYLLDTKAFFKKNNNNQ